MKAAALDRPGRIAERPLEVREVERPEVGAGQVLLRVKACGVCRTDLHIVEGELTPKRSPLIPGHQIVGEVVEGGMEQAGLESLSDSQLTSSSGAKAQSVAEHSTSELKLRPPQIDEAVNPGATLTAASVRLGMRVGVCWLGGVDGTCALCRRGMENLCDAPVFTGYTVDGGYAEYAVARADFVFPLPEALEDMQAAPLLCAGIIGFRSMRVAGVEPGERVGLFGFGASAHLAIAVLRAWKCEVYVSTRGESHRRLAESLGARWVGSEREKPPVQLDRAITFAPSGNVVVAALSSLRKGGVVAINAIHLDRMPEFDYDSLLWGERQLRSVANMTRQDARDFLQVAAEIALKPKVTIFSLDQANEALAAVKNDAIDGAAVIVP